MGRRRPVSPLNGNVREMSGMQHGQAAAHRLGRFSPTTLADIIGRSRVMDSGLRPLWQPVPRVAGPAFAVRCGPGDNLMLHAAIHRAPPGSIIVVESGDLDHALAGGNVCAVAHRRGVAALVVDGVIRDIAEVREIAFPVFGRGILPYPGTKTTVHPLPLNEPIRCGRAEVNSGDVIVADEEGIVVVPKQDFDRVVAEASARVENEAAQGLDDWALAHKGRIDKILVEKGFDTGPQEPSFQ